MNNVLIDERRIQVDFSQSVSKLMPRNKNNQSKQIKSAESKEKSNSLVPKGRTNKDYYGDKKYEMVSKETSSRYQQVSNQGQA